MRRGVLTVVVAATLALALVASGCGLPDDDVPRPIAADDAPIDLAPTTVTTVGAGDEGDDTVAVFFMNGDTGRLDAVRRPVASVIPKTAIDELLRGPLPDEPDALVSAVPPDTVLNMVSLENGTLTIDLGPAGTDVGIQSVAGTGQLQAFAQLVHTATGVSGVRDVRFRVAGETIAAATEAGATTDPVGRSAYPTLTPSGGG